MSRLAGLVTTLLCSVMVGCGYHTNARVTQVPENVRTIAVPAFVNQSRTYRIEQMLTEAVVREFLARTHYKIQYEANPAADATLSGTVLATSATPSAYNSQTGSAASVQVTVVMSVSLKDRDGKVLFENGSYVFRDQYQVSQQVSSFFEENSPALQRLSQEFARTLVSNILEGF